MQRRGNNQKGTRQKKGVKFALEIYYKNIL
jgi:hypothetical protein